MIIDVLKLAAVAVIALCAVLVVYKKERPGMREIFFGAAIGIPNFFSSKFLLFLNFLLKNCKSNKPTHYTTKI